MEKLRYRKPGDLAKITKLALTRRKTRTAEFLLLDQGLGARGLIDKHQGACQQFLQTYR